MEPPSTELCHQTLYYSGTREPDLVLKWLYNALFDRLVKRIKTKFKQAEPVAQDIAVGALEKILSRPLAQHRNRSFGEFMAYCHSSADWSVADYFEKGNAIKRGAGLIESLDQEGVESRIQYDTAADSWWINPKMLAAMLEAMKELTEEERTIVDLHYLRGESLESIGDRYFQGTNPSTLFDRKQRALRKLRKALERWEEQA